MTLKLRVRFAPSPTGELHVGNVRTATRRRKNVRTNNVRIRNSKE